MDHLQHSDDTPTANASGVTLAASDNVNISQHEQRPIPSPSDTEVEVENNDDGQGKDFIQKRLTLSFRNLTVRVMAADEALGETLWSRVDPTQLKHLFTRNTQPMRVRQGSARVDGSEY